MDIGKPVRIHNIPEPRPIRRVRPAPVWEPNAAPIPLPRRTEKPIPVPDWPVRKKVEVESE